MKYRPHLLVFVFASVSFFLHSAACSADRPKVTNRDVVKMVKAGLSSELIIQTIKSGTPDFDTSADGLILLKKEGVPDSVIRAMIDRSPGSEDRTVSDTRAGSESRSSRSPSHQGSDASDPIPGGAVLVDGGKRIRLKRTIPAGTNTGGGGLKMFVPFRKAKIMQTFNGSHAAIHRKTGAPTFEVWLPADLNPGDGIVLLKLVVKPDHREISVASGRFSGQTGFSKGDIVPVNIEEGRTKTIGGTLQKACRASPVKPLSRGEYAIVVQGDTYYDFGID
jgi:hypothetical protein